jgi:hypothetical protein
MTNSLQTAAWDEELGHTKSTVAEIAILTGLLRVKKVPDLKIDAPEFLIAQGNSITNSACNISDSSTT